MNEGETIELRSGLTKTCVKKGQGETPTDGLTCVLNYHGTLDNGTVFDSTRGRKPFKFILGMGEVIKGWDIAVATMQIGEKAVVHIPADYGYGGRAIGPIPANSELTFEVELVEAYDHRVKNLKWQLLGLVLVILFCIFIAPKLQEGHYN